MIFDMGGIPQYSSDALEILDVFYQDYVSAIFYFEDSHHESVYEALVNRLVPKIRSFQVICLGGKTKMIAKTKESRPAGAKWIFVLDKDFDDLLDTVYSGENVYYLRAFSIENYLADWMPLAKIAVEIRARDLTYASAKSRCSNFPDYFLRLKSRLLSVSKLFVVARRYRVSIETTKMSIENLLAGSDLDSPIPTDEWMIDYKSRIQANAHGSNEWLADEAALQVAIDCALESLNNTPISVENADAHICGKHLLGCIIRYVQRALDVQLLEIDSVELYLRMITHANLSRLDFLRDSIIRDHPDLVVGAKN